MTTLGTFRMLRLHLINAFCGIYVAAAATRLVGQWWPAARIPVFVVVAFFYIAGALAAALRALHRGKPTAVIRILEFSPFILIGATLLHLIAVGGGRLSDYSFRWPIDFIVIPLWIIFSAALVEAVVDKDRLDEEIEKESHLTNRSSQPTTSKRISM